MFGREEQVECSILCVSRHQPGRYQSEFGKNTPFKSRWHDQTVTGTARFRVIERRHESLPIGVPVTVVEFHGKQYPVLFFRTGLEQTVHVVMIWNPEEPESPVWELYTDILTPGNNEHDEIPEPSGELQPVGV